MSHSETVVSTGNISPLHEKSSPTISHTTQVANEIVFGSIAGMVGKVFEYPFDTIKVRLQSQTQGGKNVASTPLACFRHAITTDGFFSLYRGMAAPLFGAAVENSSLFFSYDLAQWALRSQLYKTPDGSAVRELSLTSKIFCGAASGAFTSLLLTPIELVKCQMQVPASSPGAVKPSAWQIVRDTFHRHGVAGFWHGQFGTFLRETGGSAAWFGTQSAVTRYFQKRQLRKDKSRAETETEMETAACLSSVVIPVHQQLLAGAFAGMGYNFIFYPADTIKSCMQTQDVKTGDGSKSIPGTRLSFAEVGREIWRTDGIRGMYRGCGITLLRSAPGSALIFYVHDALFRLLADWKKRQASG